MAKIINTADLTPASLAQLSHNHGDWIYNGLDVCVTFEVLEQIEDQLDDVSQKIYDFSRALQAPILEMSMRGLRVDIERRDEVLAEFEQKIERIGHQLDRIISEGVGIDISWSSPKQLMTLFYDVMQFTPVRKRNPKGQMVPTMNREAIEKLSQYYLAQPICSHLLHLRDLQKKCQFLRTGIDADGRMRTSFNIAGTTTGRLASSMSEFGTGTNLQNVAGALRSVFVADPGMKFANLDLEQADARNVGAIIWNLFYHSHGEREAGKFLDAAESGDLHTRVCSMAWRDMPWTGDRKADREIADQIAYRTDSYRQLAKKLGHGTNFLGQPNTMAKHTKVDKTLIEDFQNRYFAAFPLIGSTYGKSKDPNWHNHVRSQLWNTGQLTTLMGRRRFFFGHPRDEATIREAVAYEPQSLTGDEINTGMLAIWRAQRVQLLVQVHDSILIQYPEELEDEIVPWALDMLRTTLVLAGGREFTVPTEAKVGWNWGDQDPKAPDDNPDGLIKWTGHDSRKRQRKPREMKNGRLSLRSIL